MKHLLSCALASCLVFVLLAQASQAGNDVKAANLEKLNTAADEDDPFPLADNLGLFYASNAGGTWDILLARRASARLAWPAGKPFVASKDADERSPFFHKAGILYFATNEVPDEKLAKLKNFDIVKKMGEMAPIPIIGISEKSDELHPWLTPGGKEFYFSRKTEEGWLQFVADGPVPGPIGKARPVGFPVGFHHATLNGPALTMYLQGPVDEGRTGIFRSKRGRVGAPWSKPEAIADLNDASGKRGDMSPSLTADGGRLYFVSDRTGGKGGLDIWSVLTSALK